MKILGWFLLIAGLLGLSHAAAGPADSSKNVVFLREQYALLNSLSPARQEQLRKLDADFHALDKETQAHLQKVLDNYNHWLSRLSDDDEKWVMEATTARERLVRNNWDDIKDDRYPLLFQTPEFRTLLQQYVKNLESQLPESELARIRRSRDMNFEERFWFRYLAAIAEISERFTLLPGPADGPRQFETLPASVKDAFEKDKAFSKKKLLPVSMQSAVGSWPGFAMATTDYARKNGIKLPEQLGPANKAAMPPEVRAFIEAVLEPTLKKMESHEIKERAEQARRDLLKLTNAEDKWPDYPRAVMELAKSYKLNVPGWMPPGEARLWERFKVRPKK
ncbi:MAG: hypothetical protein K8T89_05470 [Planctomycetes bacterium]|nr:hypothetical protein [Planctomycetota bacterium]